MPYQASKAVRAITAAALAVAKWCFFQLDVLLFSGLLRHLRKKRKADGTREPGWMNWLNWDDWDNLGGMEKRAYYWRRRQPFAATCAQEAQQRIKTELHHASWWGIIVGSMVLAGQALQFVSYIWGTAVVLSGLLSHLSAQDFYVVSLLVMIGGSILLCNALSLQMWVQEVPGILKDGCSGHIVPVHDVVIWLLGGLIGYFAIILSLAGFGLGIWRLKVIAGAPSEALSQYTKDVEDRFDSSISWKAPMSLLVFYIILMFACAMILFGKVLHRFLYGDTHFLYEGIGDELIVSVDNTIHKHPDTGIKETGLRLKYLKRHFLHVYDATVLYGVWQGSIFASPLGYLLQEYYLGLGTDLVHFETEKHMHCDLFNIIQLFYAHGSAVDRLLIERWEAGLYDAPIMLVRRAFRPGPKFSGEVPQYKELYGEAGMQLEDGCGD